MDIRSKRFPGVAALILAVWILLPAPGSAQIELPPLPDPTASSSPSPSPKPKPRPTSTSGSTSTKEPAPAKTRSTTSRTTGSHEEEQTVARAPARPALAPVVEEQLSPWEEKMRLTARTTTHLLELLDRTVPGEDRLTFAEKARGFGRFPVVGYVWYHDDWAAPRYFPYFHLHEGNDLFAEEGTPVIAVTDGVIWKLAKGGSGGNAVWLLGDDDVRYYYGHLQKHAKGLTVGQRVKQGDLIAYVGASGESAAGTYPHVHFEVNPGGLGTVNPKSILDGWLNAAETQASHTVAALRRYDRLAPLGAARWSALTQLFSEPAALPPALWTAGLDGAGATLAHADLALAELLAAHDWESITAVAGATGALGSTLDRLSPFASLLHAHAADGAEATHAHE